MLNHMHGIDVEAEIMAAWLKKLLLKLTKKFLLR
jgi:hypothetical protein